MICSFKLRLRGWIIYHLCLFADDYLKFTGRSRICALCLCSPDFEHFRGVFCLLDSFSRSDVAEQFGAFICVTYFGFIKGCAFGMFPALTLFCLLYAFFSYCFFKFSWQGVVFSAFSELISEVRISVRRLLSTTFTKLDTVPIFVKSMAIPPAER